VAGTTRAQRSIRRKLPAAAGGDRHPCSLHSWRSRDGAPYLPRNTGGSSGPMTGRDQLRRLASIIKRRNLVDAEIAGIIGRPAHPGHIGEFVAAAIFDIGLLESATSKGADGHFTRGPLSGRSVNIKKYSKDQGVLDVRLDALPDFFLVLTGARTPAASSRGTTAPWIVESVYLLEAAPLVAHLRERGVTIGVATSVRRHVWHDAEIYPCPNNSMLRLTPEQVSMIELFGDS